MSFLASIQALQSTQREPDGGVKEVAFPIIGERLPTDYLRWVDMALGKRLSQWVAEPLFAVLPVRAPEVADGWMVSRRSRLTLRVPETQLPLVLGLEGAAVPLGEDAHGHSSQMILGAPQVKSLRPHATLGSALVLLGERDEAAFLDQARRALDLLGVETEVLCGRAGKLDWAGESGYGLVLNGLSDEDSLRVQCAGMGRLRRQGCGVFVPNKVFDGPEGGPE